MEITTRAQALQVIIDVLEHGAYSNLALRKAILDRPAHEAAFIKQLVFGTLTYRISLDYLLDQWLKHPLSSLTPSIRNLLRMGLFQVLYLDVPDYAAVAESVQLAHRVGHRGVAGLVNAVLRRAVRERNSLPWPQTDDTAYDLSIRYSFPKWMIQRWLQRFGVEETQGLCAAHNQPAGLSLRVNNMRTDAETLLTRLRALGLTAAKHKLVDNSLSVVSASLPQLDAWQKGYCTVQGAASTLVGQVVDPRAGQLIYDVCAAPGGKALHMAELMQDKGKVIALDVHKNRLGLIDAEARRLQIENVEPRWADATVLSRRGWPQAQRVLVDAPCSGLGVLRRKPDIRWNRSPDDLRELAGLQLRILSKLLAWCNLTAYWYIAFVVLNQRKLEIIDAFRAHHPTFEPAAWPHHLEEAWAAELRTVNCSLSASAWYGWFLHLPPTA